MTELAISSSPRSTWLWAPDPATLEHVRQILGEACRLAQRGRVTLPMVLDIDIGVDALIACQTLAAAGFTFRWHDSQFLLNRHGWPNDLPGMPVEG